MEVAQIAPPSNAKTADWRSIHHRLVPLMRPDDRRSWLCIGREYLSLTVVLALGFWLLRGSTPQRLGLAIVVPAGLMVMAAVAALQHRLSGLAHEASHYVLLRHPAANELVSDLLLMFPIMAITQRYRESHFGHHRYVNDAGRDPDWIRLAAFEPMRFPIPKARFLVRYVLRGLWPPAILGYLLGRAKAANLSMPTADKPLTAPYRVRVARCLRGAYWMSIVSMVHAFQSWNVFLLFWVAPLLTFYPLFMLLREIAHHANAPDAGDFTNSRLFRVNPVMRWAVFPYGQDFHLLHHLFAMVPHHRMPQAHAILCEYPPYRENVVVCQGYFWRRWGTKGPSLLEVLARPVPTIS
jgi:fatty acid desaturase